MLAALLPSLGDAQQLGNARARVRQSGDGPRDPAVRVDDQRRRRILPTIAVPTLVVHADEDLVPVQGGRFIADRIPGARMLEVKGRDHAPWLADHPELIADDIEEFLTGARHAATPDRVLSTVLFTDIVGSTERAAELGDAQWRAVLERHGEVTRAELGRFGGKEVKSTGDGFLATFDGPAAAIRCAEAIRGAVHQLGIEIRMGIHTGECEVIGEDVGGMAVHIASRVNGLAAPGEVLVSRTVRDLVVGSGIAFEERGIVELLGVPGTWQLLAVDRHGPRAGSAEAELASNPHPRTSDRDASVGPRPGGDGEVHTVTNEARTDSVLILYPD